jgi:ELWxxDGT repeat protein
VIRRTIRHSWHSTTALVISASLSVMPAESLAATAALVRNVNAAVVPQSSYPRALGMLGGKMLFGARDAQGEALWSTDGTAGGTTIIKRDINVFVRPAPTDFIQVGSRAYFTAAVEGGGLELWSTDGTTLGTLRNEHLPTSASTALPEMRGAFEASLVFVATGEAGISQLYVTDSSSGDTRVLTAFVGDASAPRDEFLVVGNKFYFTAQDASYDGQIWVSDGTAAGTREVTNSLGSSNSVALSATYNPQSFHRVGDQVLYTSDGLLWRIDIASDTIYAVTAADGSDGFGPPEVVSSDAFVELNGFLVFIAADPAGTGLDLWRTDGTTSGTYRVAPIVVGIASFEARQAPVFRKVGDKVVFIADDGVNGSQLWSSDGTAPNTVRLTNATKPENVSFQIAVPVATVGDVGYFNISDGADVTTWSMWRTDGTLAGTRKVNGFPAIDQSLAGTVRAAGEGNQLYFANFNGTDVSLLKYDASVDSTTLLKAGLRIFGPYEYFYYADGLLYFSNDSPLLGNEPWISDGTATGTRLIADLNPQTMDGSAAPGEFVDFNGGVAFAADDGVNGRELWITDGTLPGTRLLADVNPGPAGSNPSYLFAANAALYFFATDVVGMSHFMRLPGSGTAESLAYVMPQRPVFPGFPACEQDAPVVMDGKVYFAADDGSNGVELWTSDGTASGTRMVADIGPGFVSSDPCYLTVSGNRLFFTASSPDAGTELWISDGTATGTIQVADIFAGSDTSAPRSLMEFNGNVYFGAYEPEHGAELWKSDGTATGTVLAAEFAPSAGSSGANPKGVMNGKLLLEVFRQDVPGGPFQPRLFSSEGTSGSSVQLTPDTIDARAGIFINGGKAYFVGYDSTAGFEPWVTDGTANGTQRLSDINATGDSGTTWFADFRGVTLFGVVDPTHGDQIWRTNGDPAGTTLLANVLPPATQMQSVALFARHRIAVGQEFLFVGTDPTVGSELFALTNTAPTAAADSVNSANGASVTINVLMNDTDAEGSINPASVLVVTNPSHGTVTAGTAGALIYTPTAEFSGTDTFAYVVEDDQGAVSNAATVTVTVTPTVITTARRGGGGIDPVQLLALLALLGMQWLSKHSRRIPVAILENVCRTQRRDFASKGARGGRAWRPHGPGPARPVRCEGSEFAGAPRRSPSVPEHSAFQRAVSAALLQGEVAWGHTPWSRRLRALKLEIRHLRAPSTRGATRRG